LRTAIIPTKPQFYGEQRTLDYKAICVFAATGFFLDDTTYYREQKVLRPSSTVAFAPNAQEVISQTPYFNWHYKPIERPFRQVVTEFGDLFESIISEQTSNRQVILPLSGGLDSRTQAVALHRLHADVSAYGYEFDGGHQETLYGKHISKVCN